MVVLGTVFPFSLVVISMQHLRASQASVVGMTEPIFATAIAWLVLGEALKPIQIAGRRDRARERAGGGAQPLVGVRRSPGERWTGAAGVRVAASCACARSRRARHGAHTLTWGEHYSGGRRPTGVTLPVVSV